MAKKKTWTEKLEDSKDLPKVETIAGKMMRTWGQGTLVIPAPKEVDEVMRKVPYGKVTTINEIRSVIARKHKTTICCPITAGIFARIAAGAAEEQRATTKDITPYWRTLRVGGIINKKYPGGAEGQRKLLEEEGHTIAKKGKNFIVSDYIETLAKL